jgi:hypothetical protein
MKLSPTSGDEFLLEYATCWANIRGTTLSEKVSVSKDHILFWFYLDNIFKLTKNMQQKICLGMVRSMD